MPADILPKVLSHYIANLVPERPTEMEKMEAYAQDIHFPIIGPAEGQLCYMLARLSGARQVFELGSGFGYSTAWFARAVQENGGGKVYHVVWDEKLSAEARAHLQQLGLADSVEFVVSEAVQALRQMDGPFDLIFNDIDKEGYPDSLPVIYEKLRPGGLLLVDNLFWRGQVFDPRDQTPQTRGIRSFTQMITRDPAWITTIVSVRDGLLVAIKRE